MGENHITIHERSFEVFFLFVNRPSTLRFITAISSWVRLQLSFLSHWLPSVVSRQKPLVARAIDLPSFATCKILTTHAVHTETACVARAARLSPSRHRARKETLYSVARS